MNASYSVLPSTEPVLAMMRGELSSAKRLIYRTILILTSIWVGAIISLWITEPGILPFRLHISFSVFSIIGIGWIAVLSNIVIRRNCPTMYDRIASGWMAVVACVLFLAVAVSICVVRQQPFQALSVGIVGLTLLGVALSVLHQAYWLRAQLQAKLAELEGRR